MTAAIEAAEAGLEAVIVERKPYLGGRVAQLYRYFPKLCPPYCGLEINFKRIKGNPAIKYYTQAELESVAGSEGDFEATIKLTPRYVNEKCTNCGECSEACDVERPNDFNLGMDNTSAIYLPHDQAFPMRYVVDAEACKGSDCTKCVDACKYGAIDMSMEPETINLKAKSIVYATGWDPYDAAKIENLNFGTAANVITNVMMERLAAPNGPTGGRILRPSDGKEARKVAFAQCAGSRDQNNLDYCSAICCMASLKQATYLREKSPDDTEATIYYIDLRAPGRYEDFLRNLEEDEKVSLVKGKVAKIEEDAASGDVIITAEDVLGGGKIEERYDMVVLAAGMEPAARAGGLPSSVNFESNGLIDPDNQAAGVYAAGVAMRPDDVATSIQSATGVALKSLQSARGGE
jgi:quinone-modifying oxidoreductase subunit QmoA